MRAIATIFLFAVFLIFVGSAGYIVQSHIETKDIHVVSKERLMKLETDNDGKSTTSYKNFVYSTDETYIVEDSFWNWHFTAGTVYARVQPNETCRVKLAGYRIGFISMYQNIIEVTCHA